MMRRLTSVSPMAPRRILPYLHYYVVIDVLHACAIILKVVPNSARDSDGQTPPACGVENAVR